MTQLVEEEIERIQLSEGTSHYIPKLNNNWSAQTSVQGRAKEDSAQHGRLESIATIETRWIKNDFPFPIFEEQSLVALGPLTGMSQWKNVCFMDEELLALLQE
ncbi:hypothetical protein AAC387_Pa02g1561 [Persea americana]